MASKTRFIAPRQQVHPSVKSAPKQRIPAKYVDAMVVHGD